MLTLQEPVVSLEKVKIRAIHLTSLDLEVSLTVRNPNPIDAVLRELPFRVFFQTRSGKKEIASGNTGRFEIPANGSIVIPVEVTSSDLAIVEALAGILEKGDLQLDIEGNAVIDHIMGWTLPITETVDVTTGERRWKAGIHPGRAPDLTDPPHFLRAGGAPPDFFPVTTPQRGYPYFLERGEGWYPVT